jgi:transcription initiation factor IIE alpha subunit
MEKETWEKYKYVRCPKCKLEKGNPQRGQTVVLLPCPDCRMEKEKSILSALKDKGQDKFTLVELTGLSLADLQEELNMLKEEGKIISGLERKEGTGDYERIYHAIEKEKSVLTEADLEEIARILPPTTVSAIYKVEQKALANYKKGLREKVQEIIDGSKEISQAVKEGKIPTDGRPTREKAFRRGQVSIGKWLLKELGEK